MTFAECAAREAGADWRGLHWTGPKPAAGLPAAARRARHRLIAEAARAAGARVILFAHTADDIAEAEVMRAEGSTLGRLRDWSPSPVWPEGRGLMLLRPMLTVGRLEIRTGLAGQGASWIDDPANVDPRFARSRARQMLTHPSEGGGGIRPAIAVSRKNDGRNAERSILLSTGEGVLKLHRTVDGPVLAAALVSAGGGDRLPRGDRLDTLIARLRSGADFTSVLCGTRLEAAGKAVFLMREAGEFTRRPRLPLSLFPGVEAVWDGRWAVTVETPGWSAVPAAGRMAALSGPDRAVLKALPPAARGSIPVLIRNDGTAPVLAERVGRATTLVDQRLALALDRMTHERDLGGTIHGALPWNPLFSEADITDDRALWRTQGPRRE